MRLLYLDDSGKTDPNHPSKYVVYGGISVPAGSWSSLHRKITGAKKGRFPLRGRGNPNAWELKSKDFLTPNAWKRRRNRDFCYDLVRILEECECSVYAVASEKAKSTKTLNETWLVPLLFQRLTAKFIDEVTQKAADAGLIICDWSSYKLDNHLSNCVQSYAVSRGYNQVIGGVTYASSHAFTTIQAADLISAAFRISYEGGDHLGVLVNRLSALQYRREGASCVEGFPIASVFRLF